MLHNDILFTFHQCIEAFKACLGTCDVICYACETCSTWANIAHACFVMKKLLECRVPRCVYAESCQFSMYTLCHGYLFQLHSLIWWSSEVVKIFSVSLMLEDESSCFYVFIVSSPVSTSLKFVITSYYSKAFTRCQFVF